MQDVVNWIMLGLLGLLVVVFYGLGQIIRLLNRISDQLASILRSLKEEKTMPLVQSAYDVSAQATG